MWVFANFQHSFCHVRNVSYNAATIPSSSFILANFLKQAKSSRPEVQFFEWLRSQINKFLSDVDTYQDNLIGEYRQRLDKAMEHATQVKKADLNKWEVVAEPLYALKDQLPLLLEVK